MNRKALKRMIQQEIARVREDALFDRPEVGEPHYMSRNDMSCPSCGMDPCQCDDYGDACPACGMNPCQCVPSSGYSMSCAECGDVMVMQEGCGCGGSEKAFEPLSLPMFDMQSMSMCPSCGMDPCQCGVEDNHHRGAYMAHPQLHKIEKYARELQQMIPQGHDLDDWMRSHISQAADDLAEVYHKLEYKSHSDF